MEHISCNECSVCVSVCSSRRLQLPNYTKKVPPEEVGGLLEGSGDDVAALGFSDNNLGNTAADNGRTVRFHYQINKSMVRMSSTTILDQELTLKALDLGADGARAPYHLF